MSGYGVPDDRLRLSDAERNQAAADLGEHYVQGRLTVEEHGERLDRIWAAKTRGELGPIFADLPGRPPVAPRQPTPGTPMWAPPPRRRGRGRLPAPFVVLLVVLVALTVLTHLPLIIVGLGAWLLLRHRPR